MASVRAQLWGNKVGQVDTKHFGYVPQGQDGDVALACFESADMGAVNTKTSSKFSLRKVIRCPTASHHSFAIHALSHFDLRAGRSRGFANPLYVPANPATHVH
jgi:hypothetical protein